jgi:hypothetical protein
MAITINEAAITAALRVTRLEGINVLPRQRSRLLNSLAVHS